MASSQVRPEGYEDVERVVRDPARVAAVQITELLRSQSEVFFDRLTRLAAELLDAPAAFLSLVDQDSDFYKSLYGFEEPLKTERSLSGVTFCHYTLVSNGALVVPDARADPTLRDVPTIRSMGVIAYVGVPLLVSDQPVGAFCVIDKRSRNWSDEQVEILAMLARAANAEIATRVRRNHPEAVADSTTEALEETAPLSPREKEVLLRLIDGKRIKEIAFELNLSEKTVSTYRSRLLEKLNLRDSRDLFLYAVRNGLLDPTNED